MPTVLVKGECDSTEAKRDLYFRLTLKAGEKAKDVDISRLSPHLLVHVGSRDKADVISFIHGGHQSIIRVGQKLIMHPDKVAFLMTRYPGTIEVIGDSSRGDNSETNLVLMDQIKKHERSLQLLQADKDELAEKLRTATDRADENDRLASLRLVEKDKVERELEAAKKELLLTVQALNQAKVNAKPGTGAKTEVQGTPGG